MNFISMCKSKSAYVLLLLVILASCTPQKKLIYFQGTLPNADSVPFTDFEMTVSNGDFLTFQIYTENPEGLPGLETTIDKQVIDNRTAYEKSIVVDNEGNIDLPLIGKVRLTGLTLKVAKDTLVERFKQFMDNPSIQLKKLSFKVTFLGEFNKPGVYYVPSEKLTFTEGLGLAGDLTNFADRTQFKIFRKSGNGYIQIPIDLTSMQAFSPQHLYIYPDDVIYVKAIRRKALSNISTSVLVVTSIISTLVITMTLILKF
jgi:polysaccharide export outer membrane protein